MNIDLLVQEKEGKIFKLGQKWPWRFRMESGDRKWCRQTGSRQSTPLSTIRTRYGISVSTPEATQTGKTQQNSLPEGGRYRISVSTPHRRYGHRLRTPFLRTPFPRLLWKVGKTTLKKFQDKCRQFLIVSAQGQKKSKIVKKCIITVRVKIITGSLVSLENVFPQSYRYHYRLEFGWIDLITITVTVLASAVTPSLPLVPNYHLERHMNLFSRSTVTVTVLKCFWIRSMRERKIHKHKQICGTVPGLGGWQEFVYVFFFGSFFPYGGEKHINKIPPKNPGTIPWKFCLRVFSLCAVCSQ